jgi:hypothetical protein
MFYADGSKVNVGDTVKLWSDRFGVVVCSIDTNEFVDDFPRQDWAHLASGVLIRTADSELFHYTEPDEDLELVERRAA